MEDEWRVVMNDSDNFVGKRLKTDIVSAIYIDYSILQEEKAKQIIKLAEENKWKLYVRYFSDYEAEYRYDTIENISKLVKATNDIL